MTSCDQGQPRAGAACGASCSPLLHANHLPAQAVSDELDRHNFDVQINDALMALNGVALSALADDIEKTHHAFLRKELPRLRGRHASNRTTSATLVCTSTKSKRAVSHRCLWPARRASVGR